MGEESRVRNHASNVVRTRLGLFCAAWLLFVLAACAPQPAPAAPGPNPSLTPVHQALQPTAPVPATDPVNPETPPVLQATIETPAPEATPTIRTTSQPTTWVSPTPPCYRADFVKDILILDGTRFEPGEILLKEWRVRNSGSCSWARDVQLDFLAGDPLSGPASLPLQLFQPGAGLVSRLDEILWQQARLYALAPGEEADLAAFFRAPDEEGEYRSLWQITGPEGQAMGQVYLFIRVRTSKAFSVLDWSGVWRHAQPAAWSGEQELVISQSGVNLEGYYYAPDGVPHLIEAVVSLDGDRVEGAVGEPWTDGATFYLERLASGYQFHGRILESPFAQSAWCAARGAAALPMERCLLAP